MMCGNTGDIESSFVIKTTLLGADCPDACVNHLPQLRREYAEWRSTRGEGRERIHA